MLIGTNAYWSIVQETVVRGPGPTTVESKLGYLLSRPLCNYKSSGIPSVLHLSSVPLYDSAVITEVCPAQWWGYCPSADNPADNPAHLLTRGVSISSLQTSKLWTYGPE